MLTSSVLDLLKKKRLDAILFSSPKQIVYLTSYGGLSQTERDAFLLTTEKRCYVFTNPLVSGEIKEKIKGIIVIENTRSNPFAKNLADVIKKEKIEKIGFESNNLTVTEYLTLTENISSRFISIDLNSIRAIKNENEVQQIKKACDIAKKAYILTRKKIKPGITEKEVADMFEIHILKLGASLSFPTIVAFGKNAAIPHHHSDETKLKTNEIILMDFGAEYNNYCSDITRTFIIGKPLPEQRKALEVVQTSQKLAAEFIENSLKERKEISAVEVDDIAREYIIKKGYPSFPHSLGHGIGIEVHEAPSISPASSDKLSEGMVFSLEPGIYIEGKFGVRVEDLYTIQNGKLIQLTMSES
jgi:Xaa-Pro aminopeptidase